ncbi:MAG: alpha-L-fucosidase [Candidatus Binatia bacterium]
MPVVALGSLARRRAGRLARRLTALTALLAIGAGTAQAGAPPCPSAQFTLAGAPVGRAPASSQTVELGVLVGVGDACPLVQPRYTRSTRNGVTRIHARWDSCPGFTGPVRLRARIADGCTNAAGALVAKGYRRNFKAVRTDCGDGAFETAPPAIPYAPNEASLATHPMPRWFADAKFGIMIHWGIFTIPAWAETTLDAGEWLCCGRLLQPPDYGREFFTHIPYVEWYPNTILIPGSPAQLHHIATYGADFPYESFRAPFESAAAAWSADAWADLFQAAGARYVVLVTKHHDGFSLWPTAVPHPTRPGWNMARDVVGELTGAVRRRCMRMGLYYSGGFDWSIQPGPVASALDAVTVLPQTPAYAAYADGQWRELIARYRPAVLWNDIGYPAAANPLQLFADYYNAVPDGVINDRFQLLSGTTHHDYVTPEFTVLTDISNEKFETVRGMGHGFGYNQNETDADLIAPAALVHLLADVVSKNGNLLLNVGPMADGTVPAGQVARLQAVGAWLAVNGAAIFGSRPWVRAEGVTGDGTPVRFTTSGDGSQLFAIVLGALPANEITLVGLGGATGPAHLLGTAGDLAVTPGGADLRVALPASVPGQPAYVLALSPPAP